MPAFKLWMQEQLDDIRMILKSVEVEHQAQKLLVGELRAENLNL